MQTVPQVHDSRTADSWSGDGSTPTLRPPAMNARVPAESTTGRYAEALTLLGRRQSPVRVPESKRAIGSAAISGVNPGWARVEMTETAHAQRAASMRLRAQWRLASHGARRLARSSACAGDDCFAAVRGTIRVANSCARTASLPERCCAYHRAAPASCKHERARRSRPNSFSSLELYGIGSPAQCASVVALAAFTFVLAFALASRVLARRDASESAPVLTGLIKDRVYMR
jgi:hypothetical protein